MITFDFETEGIVGNPIHKPPKPVGVAIKIDGGKSFYLAWGHPTGNNCTWEEARRELAGHLEMQPEWLAHNAPFEAAVLREWFGIRKNDPLKFHDTQYLIFFYDPYAFSLSLKPSAERILGLAPTEQDELKDWVLRNVPQAVASDWGAYISEAPGELVARYACGDTDRTYDLFKHCYAYAEENGMLDAYRRELRLAPILAKSSVEGTRVDVDRLAEDMTVYGRAKQAAEEYIYRALGEFNIDSDREFATALESAGQVTEWVLTPTGKRSTSRKNLTGKVKDPELLDAIAYRGILATCLGTFALPWLDQANANYGRVHAQWNQVRGDKGKDGDISGTRTGRMSCKYPNLQNIPNDFEGVRVPAFITQLLDHQRAQGWRGDDIIQMRKYMLPEQGHVWLKRDFSAQEMRIMAHFAEGKLYEAFLADPTTDPHDAVKQIIFDVTGQDLPRKYVKITGFGIMYGRGIPSLAAALGLDLAAGASVRGAYFAALPEIRALAAATRQAGRSGTGIRTWGGRVYYREVDATGRDLSYKLLNYLFQGSAADQTKQSQIDWRASAPAHHRMIAAVHDEINISVPVDEAAQGMKILRESMDAPRFDVPFCSEGYAGPNWADVRKYV